MSKLRVGVLRGGPSPEYEVSLRSGGHVLKNLPPHYEGVDVLITKDGTWHVAGVPVTPAEAAHSADVFFNALHGAYGEDGQVQKICEEVGVPYTGSGVVASALAINKYLAKDYFRKYGLKTPLGRTVRLEEDPDEVAFSLFNSVSPPWLIKPANAGSTLGVSVAKNYEGLVRGIVSAFQFSDTALVEEFVPGREASVCVLERGGGHEIHVLPPIEIVRPRDKNVFDYESKYSGTTEEVCPARFGAEETRLLEDMARIAHEGLGLRHYSRSDFLLSPNGIYIIEINSLPGLTEQSLIQKALQAVEIEFSDFLDHVLALAVKR